MKECLVFTIFSVGVSCKKKSSQIRFNSLGFTIYHSVRTENCSDRVCLSFYPCSNWCCFAMAACIGESLSMSGVSNIQVLLVLLFALGRHQWQSNNRIQQIQQNHKISHNWKMREICAECRWRRKWQQPICA